MSNVDQTAVQRLKTTYEAFCIALNEDPHQAALDCFSPEAPIPGVALNLASSGLTERSLYPIVKALQRCDHFVQ